MSGESSPTRWWAPATQRQVVIQVPRMSGSNAVWTEWQPFPDPRARGYLHAPIGPGVYEVRNRRTGEYVLIGEGKNVAGRMTSLLPAPLGAGTRNNSAKREYLAAHLSDLDYRTLACESKGEAQVAEANRKKEEKYLFPT